MVGVCWDDDMGGLVCRFLEGPGRVMGGWWIGGRRVVGGWSPERGPLLTKTQAPGRGPQCQPSWRERLNREELKSFMGTRKGFLSIEKKGLPEPSSATGWAETFPGLPSSAAPGACGPSAL